MYDSEDDEKEKLKQKMKKVQSQNDYDDNDDEGGDLESAAVAQRLIQSCSPGFFQAAARKWCCCVRMCTCNEWCSSSVMTSCNCNTLSFGALFFNSYDFDDDDADAVCLRLVQMGKH